MCLCWLPYTGFIHPETHSLKLGFVTLLLDYPMSFEQKGISLAQVTLDGQPIRKPYCFNCIQPTSVPRRSWTKPHTHMVRTTTLNITLTVTQTIFHFLRKSHFFILSTGVLFIGIILLTILWSKHIFFTVSSIRLP